ncbi:hypothetical protein BDN72DRAFT_834395 [Pluteus cervinus]|uniref:Uncharacterized protein n=1 Tax=Pluteus cervinus TaxID=181527 RepID=A0ACD3B6Q6_9AGAR|nr:hypothetical protein BDN72DRAFT_834395 [Pluteus cervinus]
MSLPVSAKIYAVILTLGLPNVPAEYQAELGLVFIPSHPDPRSAIQPRRLHWRLRLFYNLSAKQVTQAMQIPREQAEQKTRSIDSESGRLDHILIFYLPMTSLLSRL